MAIRIGHASINEKGTITGGAKGDQKQNIVDGYDTSGEVKFGSWYLYSSNGWDALIRAKDPEVAEKMAVAMEQACNNIHVGYCQSARTSLNTEAKKHNYDISKVDVDCACDCSSLIGICINAAGISNSMPSTYYMPGTYGAMEEHFEVFYDYDHTHTDKDLRRGDVLVKKSAHTIMIVGDSPLSNPPVINSVTDEDYDTIICDISMNGLEGVTTGGYLYYKYNSSTIAPWLSDDNTGDYDAWIALTTGNQIVKIDREDTTVTSIAIVVTQENSTGTTLVSNIVVKDLIPTDTVVQMYYNGNFVDAKPMIYHDGDWRKASPMLYTNGQWTEIRSEI